MRSPQRVAASNQVRIVANCTLSGSFAAPTRRLPVTRNSTPWTILAPAQNLCARRLLFYFLHQHESSLPKPCFKGAYQAPGALTLFFLRPGVEAATAPASAIGDGKGESEPPKGKRTEQGDRKDSEQPTSKRTLLRHKQATGRAVKLGVQLCGQAVLNNSGHPRAGSPSKVRPSESSSKGAGSAPAKTSCQVGGRQKEEASWRRPPQQPASTRRG